MTKVKLTLRVSETIRDWIADRARENERSANAELIAMLKKQMRNTKPKETAANV